MPLVNINRAGIKYREVLEESRRVEKTIQDNLALVNNKFAIATFSATHATEVGITNPFGDAGAPSGIQIINTDGTYAPAGATMRGLRIAEDGKLGVTVQFQPPGSGSGSQGEALSSFVTNVSMPVNTSKDVTSIPLTPGAWDVSFEESFTVGTVAGASAIVGWVSTTSATDPGSSNNGDSRIPSPSVPNASSDSFLAMPVRRITVVANTTYYLGAKFAGTSGTGACNGRITAVRAFPYLTGYTANVTALFFAP